MNFARPYNYLIAAVLIGIYLAMPTTIFARAISMETGVSTAQASYSTATAPCDDCPCSDGQNSDCCDTTFCSCACHAPLGHGLQLTYAPLLVIHNFREQSWSLPHVYLPIFVPPQNPA
jgi:hypothetical protein